MGRTPINSSDILDVVERLEPNQTQQTAEDLGWEIGRKWALFHATRPQLERVMMQEPRMWAGADDGRAGASVLARIDPDQFGSDDKEKAVVAFWIEHADCPSVKLDLVRGFLMAAQEVARPALEQASR